MKKTIWFLALASAALAAANSRSIWDGVYSPAQVERGKKAYEAQCGDCHGDNLQGDGKKSPALKGEPFLKDWKSKSVHRFIDATWRTMPPDDPRTLTRELCTDVAAYVLSQNGYPAGKSDLKADAPDLRQIIIEPPRK